MSSEERLRALAAVRAFALLLGILFLAAISFIVSIFPGGAMGWAINSFGVLLNRLRLPSRAVEF